MTCYCYMATCDYCHRPLDAGENDCTHHYVCIRLRDRRYKNKICVRCGINDIALAQKYYCFRCAHDDAKNRGYPGPK